jgi:hypothetical protein
MFLRPGRRLYLRKSGMIAPLLALCLIPIIGVLALVLDSGVVIGVRRQAQAGADAAALAAAGWLSSNFATTNGTDPNGSAATVGLQVGSDNSFSGTVVNIPPLSGQFSGQAGYAEAVVTVNQPRLFSAIWGAGTIRITARAVAQGNAAPFSKSALILLDPSSPGALTLIGSAQLVSNGTVQVDSNSSSALTINNSGKGTAPAFNIVGGYKQDGAWSPLVGSIITGASSVVDPLASLPPVPSTGLPTFATSPMNGNGSQTISPGIYNGGLSIGGGQTVTMSPGVYWMKGGTFSIANGAAVTGNGVTIYCDGSGSSGGVSFQGGGVISLTAPTSGTYAGVVIYENRTSSQPINIANGSTTTISGTIYAANAAVTYAGGASFNQSGSQVVARSLNISNNAYVGFNWSASTVARTKAYGLVE